MYTSTEFSLKQCSFWQPAVQTHAGKDPSESLHLQVTGVPGDFHVQTSWQLGLRATLWSQCEFIMGTRPCLENQPARL